MCLNVTITFTGSVTVVNINEKQHGVPPNNRQYNDVLMNK